MENDIKRKILKTAELSLEEKRGLVYELWINDVEYSICVQEWKDAVLRNIYSYDFLGEFDKKYMYSYKYSDYQYLIGDNDIANYVWEEVRFLNFMEELRPLVTLNELSNKKRLTLKK